MRNVTSKLLLWFSTLTLLPGAIVAQSLSGRFSTSLYSFEQHLSESASETQFRLYQTGQITFGNLADNRLSFHFYGQVAQEVSGDIDNSQPVPRLSNAYAQWHDKTGPLQQIRLGRQRLYSGVAYGAIDGVDVTFRVGKFLKVGGFVGLLVPVSTTVEVEDWNDSHTFGLRAGTGNLFGTRVLLSYMQRNRRPAVYGQPGRFTQRVLTFESLEQRLFGIDLYRTLWSGVSVYGRLDYDVEQERVRRSQVEFRLSPSRRLEFAAEVLHRAPFVDANSIFIVFEQNTTQDVRVRGSYRLDGNWFITGDFGVSIYEGDDAFRFGAGLRSQYGSLGYNFRRGYGGQNNGFYAALNYPLTEKLGLVASTGVARYRLFNESADDNTSLTGSVGVNYRPNKLVSIDALGQGVRSRFLDSDFRFFVKANYWFFQRKSN